MPKSFARFRNFHIESLFDGKKLQADQAVRKIAKNVKQALGTLEPGWQQELLERRQNTLTFHWLHRWPTDLFHWNEGVAPCWRLNDVRYNPNSFTKQKTFTSQKANLGFFQEIKHGTKRVFVDVLASFFGFFRKFFIPSKSLRSRKTNRNFVHS